MTAVQPSALPIDEATRVPHESYLKLFLRFLRFGLLAWGGPVAQIAMIQRELVEEERWITPARFNRTLAVYQALPGPEAHELCVYFGVLARGRIGGLLAGLGFMLPGFVLMFALSYLYVNFGLGSSLLQAVFAGFQVAVVALIVRAVHRIGSHALHNRWLLFIAAVGFAAALLPVSFILTLLVSGVCYALVRRGRQGVALGLVVVFLTVVVALAVTQGQPAANVAVEAVNGGAPRNVSAATLFLTGLRSGLLTFGGAYTAIPFMQRDAVEVGQWMTTAQFLDGLALGGVLPAPLIIFSTFVGYLGGGPVGALLVTLGVFLPAFAFTLIGHDLLEQVVENQAIHAFLDGVTAGVVGLITATAVGLFRQSIADIPAAIIFVLALVAVYRWRAKAAVAGILLGAGVLALLLRGGA